MILFLSEHFFITSKISCPSSTLKGKVYTLTRKIIFFSIFLQRNSLSQNRLIFGLLFCIRNRCPPLYVTQNKWLHLEWSRTAYHLKLILCTGRATHQMTKYTNWEDTKRQGGKQQQSDPYEENKKRKDKKCQRKRKINEDFWCFINYCLVSTDQYYL